MGFLDKLTKAVSDTVDRGKKEVDQFWRIQKVKGEIGEAERKIEDARARIQQTTLEIGEKTIAMLRAGTLANPDLSELVGRIDGVQGEVTAQEAVIADKKIEIEKIKAEDDQAKPADAAGAVVPPPPVPAAAPDVAVPSPPTAVAPPDVPPPPVFPPPLPTPPPVPTAASVPIPRFCTECGKPLPQNATVCPECGAKVG